MVAGRLTPENGKQEGRYRLRARDRTRQRVGLESSALVLFFPDICLGSPSVRSHCKIVAAVCAPIPFCVPLLRPTQFCPMIRPNPYGRSADTPSPQHNVLARLFAASIAPRLSHGHRDLPPADSTPMMLPSTFIENGTDPGNVGEDCSAVTRKSICVPRRETPCASPGCKRLPSIDIFSSFLRGCSRLWRLTGREMWISLPVGAADTDMCPRHSPKMDRIGREFRSHGP
jgi:hypothetical protein